MLRPQKRQFMCPVKGCEMEVIYLPRHLQQRPHHWSKESVMAAVSLFIYVKKTRLQNDISHKNEQNSGSTSYSNKKSKSFHKTRICPLPNCLKAIKRLPKHQFQ